MSWIEHHKTSEHLASKAQIVSRDGRLSQALELYAQAADAEQRAVTDLNPSKSRTFAISAVSAVSLYRKANRFKRAMEVAYDYLAMDSLLDFAKEQIEDLVNEIRKQLPDIAAPTTATDDRGFAVLETTLREVIDAPVHQLARSTSQVDTTVVDPFDDETWTELARSYFERVDELAETGKNFCFSNSKATDAVALIYRLLNLAQHKVRLFSGCLTRKDQSSDVLLYGDSHVAAAAESLLQKGRSEFIVVVEHGLDVDIGMNPADHPLIKALLRARDEGRLSGTFELRKAASGAMQFLKERDCLKHMIVVDGRAYRIETNGSRLKAHVNFGDEQSCVALSRLFDEYILPDSELLETTAVRS